MSKLVGHDCKGRPLYQGDMAEIVAFKTDSVYTRAEFVGKWAEVLDEAKPGICEDGGGGMATPQVPDAVDVLLEGAVWLHSARGLRKVEPPDGWQGIEAMTGWNPTKAGVMK